MVNKFFDTPATIGIPAVLFGLAIGCIAGYSRGKDAPRKDSQYYRGYNDGLMGRQAHERAIVEYKTRPKVVERTVEVEKPAGPLEMLARQLDKQYNQNDSDENKEEN